MADGRDTRHRSRRLGPGFDIIDAWPLCGPPARPADAAELPPAAWFLCVHGTRNGKWHMKVKRYDDSFLGGHRLQ